MYRVELKGGEGLENWFKRAGFLMYRVELKAVLFLIFCILRILFVPNVPCGVESVLPALLVVQLVNRFLMYRVELKGVSKEDKQHRSGVPNVPCGVERTIGLCLYGRERSVPNVPCGVESHTHQK